MPQAPRSVPGRLRPSGPRLRAASLALLLAGSAFACVPELEVDDGRAGPKLAPQETRRVELRFLRLDVTDFEQVLGKSDLKQRFPERILRETWLLDMELRPLIANALDNLVSTPAEQAYGLPASSRNMWKLLNMTPANTVLDGTSLAPLLGLGKAVGLAPSKILADLIGIPENEPIITVAMTTDAVIEHVVTTHPNAKLRRGPVTLEHPDGLYPVTPGSMPVSLYDVVTDFEDLKRTFGPASADPSQPGAAPHPGFIADASPIVAATDEFAMTVRVNLNALPYKGLELDTASVASVNSTASQINDVFDFSSPEWLEIAGLIPELVIDEMTMAIYENPNFIPGGTRQQPAPLGDSPVWSLPGWQFERLIAELAVVKAAQIERFTPCTVYSPQGEVDMPLEAVRVCMGDPQHWVSIEVDDSVILGPETPLPAPSYFWDILLEVAQIRLHDPIGPGDAPLPEGGANIAFTLRDIPVGVSTDTLEQQIRANIQSNPATLAAIAELLNENTDGEADFYYYVAKPDNLEALRGDWLFFITPDDIANNSSGDPLRPYNYARPGFFRDPELTDKASSRVPLDGDTSHEKVQLSPFDVYYVEDDSGRRFKLAASSKPGRHAIALDVTRID